MFTWIQKSYKELEHGVDRGQKTTNIEASGAAFIDKKLLVLQR
jgi:hypothetical protein